MKLRYRADIDGLRAVGVLLVVVYHGFPNYLEGGFLGVDIFFVLSGFLITGILIDDLEKLNFSLSNFYFNRIKRIFPSLVIVMATVLCAGWFIMRSEEYIQLGNETFAGSFFYSNFYYLSQDNYFDVASELKPFLHLWSLSVEEQFYLLYPIIFYFLSRTLKSRRAQILAIAALALSSFLVCFFLADSPSQAFFLPIARWWELLVGGILALSVTRGCIYVVYPNLFAFGGLVSIAFGVIFVSFIESFAAYMGLIVVLGTLVLIATGQDSKLITKTIGLEWFVKIGKISYALYLWHWPLLVLARIAYGKDPSSYVRLILIAFAFLLSWLTTRFIETPIRAGVHRGRAALVLSVLTVLIGLVGMIVSSTGGFPKRNANNHQIKYEGDTGQIEFHRYISENFYPCTPQEIYASALMWEGYVRCNQSKRDKPIDVLLLGDSHAEHLFIGLAESLKNKNVGFYIKAGAMSRSNQEFDIIYRATISDPSIQTVILGSYWQGFEVPRNELIAIFSGLIDSGKRVFVTDDIPTFNNDPDLCKFESVCTQKNLYSVRLENPSMLDMIAATKAVPKVVLIQTYKYMCAFSADCSMRNARNVLFRDKHHLNIPGSQFIGRLITQDYPTLQK